MFFLQASGDVFDWKQVLFGEYEWIFLAEVFFRTIVMFGIALTGLRILGKRGVRQLSVFELVVIITLGSAAGDPMFYQDVGLLPALVVFFVVISLYYFVTYLTGKSKGFEKLIEGKPVCLVEHGKFAIDNFKKESLAQDEFFAELRLQGVSQLGQVEQAIIETTGQISIFFYPDDEVRYGLPILPLPYSDKKIQLPGAGHYSCSFCGYTTKIEQAMSSHECPRCKKNKWVESSRRLRIS